MCISYANTIHSRLLHTVRRYDTQQVLCAMLKGNTAQQVFFVHRMAIQCTYGVSAYTPQTETEGLEPPTLRLTAGCSAIELRIRKMYYIVCHSQYG